MFQRQSILLLTDLLNTWLRFTEKATSTDDKSHDAVRKTSRNVSTISGPRWNQQLLYLLTAKNIFPKKHNLYFSCIAFFFVLLTCKCHVCRIAIKPQNILPVMLNCSQYDTSRFK